MHKISLSASGFSEEFSEINCSDIIPLTKENVLAIWQKYVDKKAASYFELSDENWFIKSEKTTIGNWLSSFNNNSNKEIADILNNSFLTWNEDDTVWFCISKYLIIQSSWSAFKSLWINFLTCEDDSPIIINSKDRHNAIIFHAIGTIVKVSDQAN